MYNQPQNSSSSPKRQKMKKFGICSVVIISILLGLMTTGTSGEPQRQLVAELLIRQGLDPLQAASIAADPRISVNSDIVIKNLFYSSPRGTAQKPEVMRVDPRLIEQGKVFMQTHANTLASVEKRFGTSPRILTAILIIESRLGTYPMPYNVANAYANLVFLLNPDYLKELQIVYTDTYPQLQEAATIARAKRRAQWAAGELYHLARIANALEIDPLEISGSFAGAMGPAQFIPSSFWNYGLDGDGDGVADPNNMADALFSMGQYLKEFGWLEEAQPDQKRKAIWHYNRSSVYVNTIMMLYEELRR
jgi:membrane-bound lytic murein transglycosylase B